MKIGLEKEFSEDWKEFWCNPNKGLTQYCAQYFEKSQQCPRTCYFAKFKEEKEKQQDGERKIA